MREHKSTGSETTFGDDLMGAVEIEAGIQAMADQVWARCHKTQTFGRTVAVKVKFADFRLVTRARSFATVIADHELLRHASVELVRALLPAPKGIRLLGVTVSNFDQRPCCPADELELFVRSKAVVTQHDAAARLTPSGPR
jgi:DNA polymerase IV